jgi:hypothetical protein
MTQPAAAGPSDQATTTPRLAKFFGALLGLLLVLALLGVGVGLSAGLAHRTYRLVIR